MLALLSAIVVVGTSLALWGEPTNSTGQDRSASRHGAPMAGRQLFAVLSAAHTNVCQDMGNLGAIESHVKELPGGSRMQGSCCSPMNMVRFNEQLAGLARYSAIAAIPADPYDLTRAQAVAMLAYYDNIRLDPAEQAVFASAQSRTADGGWCCCQCWAWYTHAGLAKYLIAERGFAAAEVVSVINLEDCCGGA